MEPILRPDERLRKAKVWPSVQRVSELRVTQSDTIISCLGFEERSSFVSKLAAEGARGKYHQIRISYLPDYPQNEEANTKTARTVNFTDITYDRRTPTGFGESVVNVVGESDTVYVDISGMSRLLIVQLVFALRDAIVTGRVRKAVALYTEPATYYPERKEYLAACDSVEGVEAPSFMSSGVYDIAVAPELSSVAMEGEDIRLIASPSFNESQLVTLVSEISPTYLDLMINIPHQEENRWRKDAILECNKAGWSSVQNVHRHEVDSLDYRETLRAILGIYADRYVYDRILVAPTGSKMQAFAIGVLKANLPDIQIVYPIPQEFHDPERYTSGVAQLYSVEFGLLIG